MLVSLVPRRGTGEIPSASSSDHVISCRTGYIIISTLMKYCCLFALPLLIPVCWQQSPWEAECVDCMKPPYGHSAIQIWANKLQMSSGDKAKAEISWEQATSHYWYGVWWPINNTGSLLGSAASFFQLIECVLAHPSTTHTSDCWSSIKNDCCRNKCSTPNWISGCWLQAGLSGEISSFSHDVSECNSPSPKTLNYFWLNPRC